MMFEMAARRPPFTAANQMSLIKFLSEDKLAVPFDRFEIFS